MSRIFREIIRKQSSSSSTRFITTFTQQNPRNHHLLPPSLLVNQSILGQTPNFDHDSSDFNLNPKNQGLTENVTHLSKLQIYPSFSFGYLVDPISASGVGPIGVEVETGHHPGMMWADSVKKKRKKKMNKHKYKKLRKRLRRKTKT